jgi:hypothetical protein
MQHEVQLYMFTHVTIDDIYAVKVKEGSDPLPCPLNVWVCMILFDIHLSPGIGMVYRKRARRSDHTTRFFLKHDKQLRNVVRLT